MPKNEITTIEPLALEGIELTPAVIASDDFAAKYAAMVEYMDKLKELKDNVDSVVKGLVKDNYMATGESTIACSTYKFTYIPETTRETFDSKALKSDDPELYKKYVKVSSVKESMRVVKAKKD